MHCQHDQTTLSVVVGATVITGGVLDASEKLTLESLGSSLHATGGLDPLPSSLLIEARSWPGDPLVSIVSLLALLSNLAGTLPRISVLHLEPFTVG